MKICLFYANYNVYNNNIFYLFHKKESIRLKAKTQVQKRETKVNEIKRS